MSVCGSSCLNSVYFCFSCCSLFYFQPCIPLSSLVSPFSLTSEWCCQIWSLSEGQDNSEETQSPCSALQPVTTIYFLVPHIHPDPRLCDITRGLNPQAPQARDHKSGGWQIRLGVKENRVGCVRCRISPFFNSFHEVRAKGEMDHNGLLTFNFPHCLCLGWRWRFLRAAVLDESSQWCQQNVIKYSVFTSLFLAHSGNPFLNRSLFDTSHASCWSFGSSHLVQHQVAHCHCFLHPLLTSTPHCNGYSGYLKWNQWHSY